MTFGIAEVVSIAGALGLGGAVGQIVGQSKDRRQARADVLEALSTAENSRWASFDNATPWSEFRGAVRAVQTKAITAQLPREAVDEYCVLVQAARWESEDSAANTDPDDPSAGGIDSYLATAARSAARAIALIAWSPRGFRRRQWRSAKKGIEKELARLQSDSSRRTLTRSREYGFF